MLQKGNLSSLLLWFNSSYAATCSVLYPTQWDGEENQKKGPWDKNNLIIEIQENVIIQYQQQ